MSFFYLISFFAILAITSGNCQAYPLDGAAVTGIVRLEGYRQVQQGTLRGRKLPPGALLPMDKIDVRLTSQRDGEPGEPDADFTASVRQFLGDKADQYSIAVLDCSDPAGWRYALHRGDVPCNPGSVGKLMVVLAVFQTLADIYPDDVAARRRVLREAMVQADSFIRSDSHEVPFWEPEAGRLTFRPLREGDRANLWTYLDWMLSASSNAAASMVMRELLLLSHFGSRYPVSEQEVRNFLDRTPAGELSRLLINALQEPVRRNGLNPGELRQGKFFTRQGKKRVPGTVSTANARQLLLFLLRLEQGRLVDLFSSREIKRLLYMTQKRIRYASSPALAGAAVYFKSGSFYKCRPEKDFVCRKYHGNVFNLMNSVAIVEAPAAERKVFYLVAIMSNVLKQNSAVDHQTLATRLHRLIEGLHVFRPGAADGKASGQ